LIVKTDREGVSHVTMFTGAFLSGSGDCNIVKD